MTEVDEKLAKLKKWIDESDNIVFFGGAGVSTDSGLADFRSQKQGLYNQPSGYGVTPEEILTPAYMLSHPAEFFDFYRTKLLNLAAPPNSVHYALAQMESAGLIKCVITQNADNLHQRAGSRKVIDIHGNVYENYCLDCGRRFPPEVVADCPGVPRCDVCGGMIRPGILLFGEIPDMKLTMQAIRELNKCDLLIIGGTSLGVYPAAGLINYYRGRKMVLVNLSETPYDRYADLIIHEKIGQVFSAV